MHLQKYLLEHCNPAKKYGGTSGLTEDILKNPRMQMLIEAIEFRAIGIPIQLPN